MRQVVMVMAFALLLSAPALIAQPPLGGRERDKGLMEVLEEIRTLHPEAWQRLQAVLGDEPQRARRRLARHAYYLRERVNVQEQDPETFALMLQQEAMEQDVRATVERYQLTEPGNAQRDAVVAELRRSLEAWFDLRQVLRARHVDRFEEAFEDELAKLDATETDPAAARATWIERITAGGPEAMAQRLEKMAVADDLEPVAPALLRAIARRDPQARRMLWRLGDKDPEALHEHLERIAQEHPELLAEARARRAEAIALHAKLRQAIRQAHDVLLPLADRRGPLEVPRRIEAQVVAALSAVVEADLAIARHNLERAERKLERKRRWFEERQDNKATIVDLQLARLLEESERYEW